MNNIEQVSPYAFTAQKMQQILLKPIGNQKEFNPGNLTVVVLKENYKYKKINKTPDCSVCMKESDGTEVCKLLNCGTSVCSDCVSTILKCPVCRDENCLEEILEENAEVVYEAESEENPVDLYKKPYYY